MKTTGLKLTHLLLEGYSEQPWKNGNGSTREIAKGSGDPFPWRLSWATVPESGPFSSYPGYDRSLTVISGGPLFLTHDENASRKLLPFKAHLFRGESETQAAVESPAEDFNLFTLRKRAKGAVYPARLSEGEEAQFSLQHREHFLFCAQGKMDVLDPNSGKAFLLASGDTLWAGRESETEFLNLRAAPREGSAIALWIVITLLG